MGKKEKLKSFSPMKKNNEPQTSHCRYLGRTNIHPNILFLLIISCFGA
jgi:hypothetical protein